MSFLIRDLFVKKKKKICSPTPLYHGQGIVLNRKFNTEKTLMPDNQMKKVQSHEKSKKLIKMRNQFSPTNWFKIFDNKHVILRVWENRHDHKLLLNIEAGVTLSDNALKVMKTCMIFDLKRSCWSKKNLSKRNNHGYSQKFVCKNIHLSMFTRKKNWKQPKFYNKLQVCVPKLLWCF